MNSMLCSIYSQWYVSSFYHPVGATTVISTLPDVTSMPSIVPSPILPQSHILGCVVPVNFFSLLPHKFNWQHHKDFTAQLHRVAISPMQSAVKPTSAPDPHSTFWLTPASAYQWAVWPTPAPGFLLSGQSTPAPVSKSVNQPTLAHGFQPMNQPTPAHGSQSVACLTPAPGSQQEVVPWHLH